MGPPSSIQWNETSQSFMTLLVDHPCRWQHDWPIKRSRLVSQINNARWTVLIDGVALAYVDVVPSLLTESCLAADILVRAEQAQFFFFILHLRTYGAAKSVEAKCVLNLVRLYRLLLLCCNKVCFFNDFESYVFLVIGPKLWTFDRGYCSNDEMFWFVLYWINDDMFWFGLSWFNSFCNSIGMF